MDDNDRYERGLKLRTEMFGREAVDKRMNAFGEFGKIHDATSAEMLSALAALE